MFRLIKITGNSLSPDYNQDDYVLITSLGYLLSHLKAGDIIVFKHPVYGTMIKQIQSIDPVGRWLDLHPGNRPNHLAATKKRSNQGENAQFKCQTTKEFAMGEVWGRRSAAPGSTVATGTLSL